MRKIMREIEFPAGLTQRLKVHPIRVVDVGARGGIEEPWVMIAPYLEVVGFEPAPGAFKRLQRTSPPNVTILNLALADRQGEVTLYETRGGGASSIYAPNMSFLDAFEREESFEVLETSVCRVDTLDNALAGAGIDRVDFLKLDTQGSELAILEGGTQALDRFVFGIETEIELNLIYEDQPLFGDIDAFLRGYDYELFELKVQWRLRHNGLGLLNGGRGQWVWGDAVYLKKPSAVAEHLSRIAASEREFEVAKLVSACLLYGIGDYALEVIALAELPGRAADELADTVRRYDELWASRFGVEYTFALGPELAARLHKLARGRGERLKRRTPDWLAVRAVRRWLAEHAPPSRTERLRALRTQLRRSARAGAGKLGGE